MPKQHGALSEICSEERVKTLSARYGDVEAERLWLACYGCAASARKIPSEHDAVFRISESTGFDYLLRIVDNSTGLASLQAAVLEHIEAIAPTLPVPQVRKCVKGSPLVDVYAGKGERHAAFATTFLPGQPLATLLTTPSMRVSLFDHLAILDKSLQGFSHPAAKRTLLWDVSHADQVTTLIEAISDVALRQPAQSALDDWGAVAAPVLANLRRQVIHNDINPSNVLVSGSGEITGIIDFGDVLEAPLVCEIATAIAYQEPADDFDRLLAEAIHAYGHRCPLTDQELAVLPTLVRARAAMVIVIAHWRAAQNPTNRDYLLRNVPLASRVLKSAAKSADRASSVHF